MAKREDHYSSRFQRSANKLNQILLVKIGLSALTIGDLKLAAKR